MVEKATLWIIIEMLMSGDIQRALLPYWKTLYCVFGFCFFTADARSFFKLNVM